MLQDKENDLKEKLIDQLKSELSKANIDFIVESALTNTLLFGKLVELSYHPEKAVTERSTWALTKIADKAPELIVEHLDFLNNHFSTSCFDGTKRNVLRIFASLNLQLSKYENIVDQSFTILQSPKEKPAARVHAMQVLYNISDEVPEIKPELVLIIKNELARSSVGFKSRASKLILKLNKTLKTTQIL